MNEGKILEKVTWITSTVRGMAIAYWLIYLFPINIISNPLGKATALTAITIMIELALITTILLSKNKQ